jgi:O-antigen ligase
MENNNRIERFTGFTLGINPLFTLLATIYLSIFKTRGLFKKIKTDSINLYFWLLLAISGVISIIYAINKTTAISCFFIPFLFIWLYILGRWIIKDPACFIQDLIRGVTVLSLITVIAKLFNLNWSLGNFKLLSRFGKGGRGEILYIADNGLGILFQTGVVGAIGSLIIYWKEKLYIKENIIAFFLCTCGLVISGSRGAMVGSLIAIVFLVIKNGFYPILGAGLVSTILCLFSKERFISAFRLQDHMTRIRIWKSSLNIIKDYPFFGVGPGNFGAIYEKYKPEIFKANNYNVSCAHSNYLNIFIGWGIIGGLLFWGWQLFILIRAAIKGLTPLQRVIIAILISFYVHIAINDLFAAYSGFLLGLIDHQSFKKSAQLKNTEQSV